MRRQRSNSLDYEIESLLQPQRVGYRQSGKFSRAVTHHDIGRLALIAQQGRAMQACEKIADLVDTRAFAQRVLEIVLGFTGEKTPKTVTQMRLDDVVRPLEHLTKCIGVAHGCEARPCQGAGAGEQE